MRKLIAGIVKFGESLTEEKRSLFADLSLGQTPDALLIGCSDSRVVPNLFASTDPGDLFVLRNIGNMIPPADVEDDDSAPAAIEFSVSMLNVANIIVCGHSECGAMQALEQGIDTLSCPHLRSWLRHGEGALERMGSFDSTLPKHDQLSQANVLQQMEHIATYPRVRERVEKGLLQIHGWWFDIAQAAVYCYEKNEKCFVRIDREEADRILSRLSVLQGEADGEC